jgi:hypothetical protein
LRRQLSEQYVLTPMMNFVSTRAQQVLDSAFTLFRLHGPAVLSQPPQGRIGNRMYDGTAIDIRPNLVA